MASNSRMHGLHEVDQKETIEGTPALVSIFVSNDSPFAFSTLTEGSCAKANDEIRSDMIKKSVLIGKKLKEQRYRINFLNSKRL